MPYIRTWNSAYEATPAGSDMRSTVDDRIRELKVDIRERMESLVTAWSSGTDPVVLKPENGGPQTGKVLMLHPSSFQATRGAGSVSVDEDADGSLAYSPNPSPGTIQLMTSLLLPATAVVTSISGLFYRNTSSAVAAPIVTLRSKHYAADFTNDASILSSTRSYLVGEIGITNVGGSGTEPLVADEIYWIQVEFLNANESPRFYGVKVVYDVPDARALR